MSQLCAELVFLDGDGMLPARSPSGSTGAAGCESRGWVGAQDAVQHFVPPGAAAPADPAQDAFPGEPGPLQGILFGDVAGLGSGLDPVDGRVGEQGGQVCQVIGARGSGV